MRELNPNLVDLELLDRPGAKRCVRSYMKNREKRHATAATLKRKEKKIKLQRREAKDKACFNWKPEDDPRFRSMIDFLIKNKIVQDDKFTYVPVVFKTVPSATQSVNTVLSDDKPAPFESRNSEIPEICAPLMATSAVAPISTGTQAQHEEAIPSPSTAISLMTPAQLAPSTPSPVTAQSMQMQAPASVSEAQSPMQTQTSTSITETQSPTASTTMNSLLQKAKNLTEELKFRIPQLRRSFEEASSKSAATVNEISSLPSTVTAAVTSPESPETTPNCDPRMMPGVLIYPLDNIDKSKRSIEDIIEKELATADVPAGTTDYVLNEPLEAKVKFVMYF